MSSPAPSRPADAEEVVRKSLFISHRMERRLQNLAAVALLNPSELLVAGADLYTLYLQGHLVTVDAAGQNPTPIIFTWSNPYTPEPTVSTLTADTRVVVSLGLRRRQLENIQALAIHAQTDLTDLLVNGAELYFLYQSDNLRIQADDGRLGRLSLDWAPLPSPRTL